LSSPKKIVVGKNKKLGKNVQLGIASGRKVRDEKLVIGDHANIRSGAVIYGGSKIGSHLETGHNAVVREENVIGNHFSLWTNSIVDYGCKIGDNVKIHCNCYVAQFTTMEDDVFLAPGVTIANDLHPGAPDFRDCMKGPTLKKGVQIGCNVTILPGVTIGEYSLIGAGSVVTKDIPAFSIAYGNPARAAKKITDYHCGVKKHFPYDHLKKLG
jgi:acetyltransferase-like isoleucine patch superfamily enzyme